MGNSNKTGTYSKKGVRYDKATKEVVSCVFCRIISGVGRITDVYAETDDCYVMESRTKYAREHLLVLPRRHIKNVASLTADDVPILNSMHDLGKRVMRERFGEHGRYQFHFHIPPFNSIDHLHLHCFKLPFNSCWRAQQNNDRFCWTSDVEDVIKLAASRL